MKATAARVKADAVAFPVPQTREQAVEAVAAIGRHQRERDRVQAAMNDELAAVRQRWEEQAAPHTDAIKALSAGVHLWAEAHRAELTEAGKTKTVRLASGEVRWRLRPPSVVVRGVENVLAALKDLGLGRFVRTREEINKDAILAEPAAVAHVKGLAVSQKEDFVIVPFETELEELA